MFIDNGSIYGYERLNDGVPSQAFAYYSFGSGGTSAMYLGVGTSLFTTLYSLGWDGSILCNGIDARQKNNITIGGNTSYFDKIDCSGIILDNVDISDNIILANGTPASGATSYSFKNSGGTITYSVAASTHYHSKLTNKTNGTANDGIDFKVGQYTNPDTNQTENVYWANEGYIRVGNYGIASSSDERLKNIISRFDNRHKQLFMNIEPIVFTWKDEFKGEKMPHDNLIHWGLSAQEMLSASKENGLSKECDIVVGSEKSEFSVRYQEVEMLAWYVTQENVRDIESLQKELEDVKNENDSLKKRISTLENAIIIK